MYLPLSTLLFTDITTHIVLFEWKIVESNGLIEPFEILGEHNIG